MREIVQMPVRFTVPRGERPTEEQICLAQELIDRELGVRNIPVRIKAGDAFTPTVGVSCVAGIWAVQSAAASIRGDSVFGDRIFGETLECIAVNAFELAAVVEKIVETVLL